MHTYPQLVVFDTVGSHENLLPLSFTRAVCEFRVGITTILEKWMARFPGACAIHTVDYLMPKYPRETELPDDCLFVAGNVIPDDGLCDAIRALAPGQGLVCGDDPVVYRGDMAGFESFDWSHASAAGDVRIIRYVFDVFLNNGEMIREDFRRLTAGRVSCPLPEDCMLIGPHADGEGNPLLFIEEGAVLGGCVINVKEGPVYIGRDAQVMEGSCLRGPLCVGDKTKIRMGSKIYGSTTFGPWCKVGGEIDNTVIFGYTNKAHDGYLGNAVIGEWCNIGAGTNASNLKNDYSKIRIWNYASRRFMKTDLQFCGLIMGDHSKAGINCMFNTATVVGVGVNVHGSGFPRVLIPSFSEGSPQTGFSEVTLKKFYDIATRVMSRRGMALSDGEREVFGSIHASAHEDK